MKVFISSVIAGFEPYREAAARGVRALGHEVVRAEDFGASPASPQEVCLRGVRDADVIVLIIGDRYGYMQRSGLSATHEEYREARERRSVLVFVQQGVEREPRETEFLHEVQAWSTGHYTAGFFNPEELQAAVTRGVHEFELSRAAGPVDEVEMLSRARALLPPTGATAQPSLHLAVAGGPRQQILRPSELEHPQLKRTIQQEALFGAVPMFDEQKGTRSMIEGHSLLLEQDNTSIRLDELGGISVTMPALSEPERGSYSVIRSLIQEEVEVRLQRGLRFTGWLLDHIDGAKRLSDIVIVVGLFGAGWIPWRTAAEHRASPHQATMGKGNDQIIIQPSPARRSRAALTLDAGRIAEDLSVLLRRELHA